MYVQSYADNYTMPGTPLTMTLHNLVGPENLLPTTDGYPVEAGVHVWLGGVWHWTCRFWTGMTW